MPNFEKMILRPFQSVENKKHPYLTQKSKTTTFPIKKEANKHKTQRKQWVRFKHG